MKIERFYFSEYEALWEPRRKEIMEQLRKDREEREKLPIEEQERCIREQIARAEEFLAKLVDLPSEECEMCVIFNPKLYKEFTRLAEASIPLAREMRANLQAFTEDMNGCISFVGDELNCSGENKNLLIELSKAASEVNVALTEDTGNGLPTDVDGAIRLEFWFEFCTPAPAE
ncbi:MAG: hypothetical protein Q4F79_11675 [Eubacteriales bacterium]|nr:hypothetical protein [Eubacteriales bacterium]